MDNDTNQGEYEIHVFNDDPEMIHPMEEPIHTYKFSNLEDAEEFFRAHKVADQLRHHLVHFQGNTLWLVLTGGYAMYETRKVTFYN